MIKGTVIWFNHKLGYGFIRHEDGREVFAHWTKINPEREGYKKLHDGQEVEYELVEGPDGPIASEIHTLPVDHSRKYLEEAPCNQQA